MSSIPKAALHLFSWILPLAGWAQFPGPAGVSGSTALYKDSSAFVAWASECTVVRGLQNIGDPTLGMASLGEPQSTLGKAGEEGGVLSLGDGGAATLTFSNPISNGSGPDFAVFENGFLDDFLELAFVEVSSDGQKFVRFPAVSMSPITSQFGPFEAMGKAEWLHNLAGKYRLFYGTPFDLEELKDSLRINIDSITHIRVVDVVGSIGPAFARLDRFGNPINDPFPTPFPSGGFDLDAVGVIHQRENSGPVFKIYPNPANEKLYISIPDHKEGKWEILDSMGRPVLSGEVPFSSSTPVFIGDLPRGLYFIRVGGAEAWKKTGRFWKE